jgi:hypothetical protein
MQPATNKTAAPAASKAPLPVGLQLPGLVVPGLHAPAKRAPAPATVTAVTEDYTVIVEARAVKETAHTLTKGMAEMSVSTDASSSGAASTSVATVRSADVGVVPGEGAVMKQNDRSTDASSSGAASMSVATVRSADVGVVPGEGAVMKKNDRTCSTCGVVGHWRGLRFEKKIDHWQEFKEQGVDTYYEVHTCMKCVAAETGVSEQEARASVLAAPIAHKKQRYDNMMEGKAMAEARIAGMDSCSRSKRRELTMLVMVELFGPLSRFIIRKKKALERVHVDTVRHAELVKQLGDTTDFESESKIIAEMEKLEVSDGWLAFEKEVDQHAYIMASSYSDAWTVIRDSAGKVTGGVNSWYVCQAKTGPWDYVKDKATPCYRITESKKWDTLHDDPLKKGQRYYCSCSAKFNANWGQIVETSSLNLATMVVEKSYMKSDVPSWDAEDIRAMELEESIAPRGARELYDKVKEIKVALCAFIVKDPEGHHRLDGKEIYDSLPEFKWKQLYNMHK